MSDVYQQSIELHRKNKGKLGIVPIIEVKDKSDLSLDRGKVKCYF